MNEQEFEDQYDAIAKKMLEIGDDTSPRFVELFQEITELVTPKIWAEVVAEMPNEIREEYEKWEAKTRQYKPSV